MWGLVGFQVKPRDGWGLVRLFTWRWAWTFYLTAVTSLDNLASSGLILAQLQSKGGRGEEKEEEKQEEEKKKEEERGKDLPLSSYVARRWPSISQENKTQMTSGFWTPNLQKNEKINVYCLSHPGCGTI